ncbi:enoyl-ACP reductase FabI [Candidatus Liberibacter americanus]|uniref:Enoyl-[acyl-carrier-protein] reductase [NADH] n=1 Tax=Candidatus Liberibacter americanus str. Sao Paulo TaxID=1261131 RepID=U6B8G4_9HYPH|nr:enoyl-ACP reductase FabI [Candidatus Liberibacter americanus]AHA28156.1 Enoyl-[acyl-carrier-protein] reductase [Candidatus Liberibacter americanus str. Sao Paulo]EMS35932.1 enoyl-ACP reductase [Candidatus Liberibacter americanus PW_SP]
MPQIDGLMKNKRGIVFGVANNRSLAWSIAKMCHDAGAEVALTWQGDAVKKRIENLVDGMNFFMAGHCNVSDVETIKNVFRNVEKRWGKIDFIVHAVAFSEKSELTGPYINTSRENFINTMDISVYSFTSLAAHAEPMMNANGSMLTLTYIGSARVMPHYNVMGLAKSALETSVRYLAMDLGKKGIRINAISAGPVKTLASSAIGDFRYILKWNEYNSPLRRNITYDEVGKSALYMLSDLSSGVTGECHYVDAGYHVVGMKVEDAPDISVVMDNNNKTE